MILLNNPYLYLKGTCEVTIKRPSDGQIVFQNNKVSTNNFTTSVNMNPIRAGLGNPIAIQLPSDASVNLDLQTEDFSMEARAMQMGATATYNAIVPVCTSITASGATLTVPDATPVAFYGDSKPYAYVGYDGAGSPGAAYEINSSGVIQNFVAVSGTTYNVIYYERRADSKWFAISSIITPGIYSVHAKMAVFSAEGTNSGNRGTLVGYASYIIPRMQFGGDATTNGSQTENAKTVLSGTALSYEDAAQIGECIDCTFPNLAYMTYQPVSFNGNNAIVGVTVVGGDIYLQGKNDKRVIPVKYIMADQSVVQPNYDNLSFTVEDTSIATVSGGVITAEAVGETTMFIGYNIGHGMSEIRVGVVVQQPT